MSPTNANIRTNSVVLTLSALLLLYTLWSTQCNVYQHTIGGVIAEVLWLPMLALLVLCPVAALFLWIKERFRVRSLNPVSMMLWLVAVVLVACGARSIH